MDTPQRRLSAFALAEVMISIGLIALVAAAVSLALNNSYQRSSRLRGELSRRVDRSQLQEILTEQLQWTKTVTDLTAEGLTVTCDNLDGTEIQAAYTWQEAAHTLTVERTNETPFILAQGIYDLDIEAHPTADDPTRLQAVTITLQYAPGASSRNQDRIFIHLLNQPPVIP